MRSRLLIVGLIALNVALGVAVLERGGGMALPAFAQPRGRTDYLAVAGHSQTTVCIYVLDTTAGRMAAFRVDNAARTVTPVPGVSVFEDMKRLFKD